MKYCGTQLETLVRRYPCLSVCSSEIEQAALLMAESYQKGNKLLVCGNGGSAADSMHIVGELMKGFVLPRKLKTDFCEELRRLCPESADYYIENLQEALPAISLVSETPLLTAYANDQAPDLIFAQQVLGYGQKGDVLLAISTSGNSKNVVNAAVVAKAKGLYVVSLTGADGGKLKSLSDVCIMAPSSITYQVQEYHLPIYHALCLVLEEMFFGGKRQENG